MTDLVTEQPENRLQEYETNEKHRQINYCSKIFIRIFRSGCSTITVFSQRKRKTAIIRLVYRTDKNILLSRHCIIHAKSNLISKLVIVYRFQCMIQEDNQT